MDILGLILLVSSVYLDLCVYRFDWFWGGFV